MVSIYLLELTNNKYYVGTTTKIVFKMDDIDYNISRWVQKYRPISILKVIPDCDIYDEDKYTRKYMDLYGVHNVRGGSFSDEHLDTAVLALIALPVDNKHRDTYDTYQIETKLAQLEAKIASIDDVVKLSTASITALSSAFLYYSSNLNVEPPNAAEPSNAAKASTAPAFQAMVKTAKAKKVELSIDPPVSPQYINNLATTMHNTDMLLNTIHNKIHENNLFDNNNSSLKCDEYMQMYV